MKIYVDGSKRSAVSRMFPVWESLGHSIVECDDNPDVQLSVVKIQKKYAPTVLRLDGIYYDKSDNYGVRNAEISTSHEDADGVVYQSLLSKKMCESFLADRKTKIWDIIHNGIDSKSNEIKPHNNVNIVSCSKWRRHKRLPEIIDIFNTFRIKYPDSILHIIGPMGRGAEVIENENVIYHNPDKKISFEEIEEIYKVADVFIHLSKKDSCPSTVVEAIGAGIPVITTNACGGATEMCEITDGCIIVDGEENDIQSEYVYSDEYNQLLKDVSDKIIKAIEDIIVERRRVVLPEQLKIEFVAKKYLDIMEKCIK